MTEQSSEENVDVPDEDEWSEEESPYDSDTEDTKQDDDTPAEEE